jgi:hypothetical protein
VNIGSKVLKLVMNTSLDKNVNLTSLRLHLIIVLHNMKVIENLNLGKMSIGGFCSAS